MNENEEVNIRYSMNRGKLFRSDHWTEKMIKKYKLNATIQKRGEANQRYLTPLLQMQSNLLFWVRITGARGGSRTHMPCGGKF